MREAAGGRFHRGMRLPPRLAFLGFVLSAAIAAGATAPVRVACIGDSITAGYGLAQPAEWSFPAQLGRLLGAGWEVRNFGVSGATLMRDGGYPYMKRQAWGEALRWRPDIAVIALGTNDTKVENIGTHPRDFTPSYRRLLADLRQANPRVRLFLCLPPPAFPAAMGISNQVLEQRILPRIRRVAAAEKLPLIDLHGPLQRAGALFPDRVHPNPEGAARIAEIIYGDLMFATQPAAHSLDPAVNTAVVPVPRLELDRYNWWQRHAAELIDGPRIDPDVVLIGDSITHFWGGHPTGPVAHGPEAWHRTFGRCRVLNLGFGWDRTQNVLWRLGHGEFTGLHPKLVILNIGTNNFSATPHARANTPAEVAAGVLAICNRVKALSPTSHLLVMAVFPRGQWPNSPFRAPIAALDAILARELAGRPDTTFLNIGNRFLTPTGELPPDMMPDGTHPSEKGYAIWGRALIESGLLPVDKGVSNLPAGRARRGPARALALAGTR